MEPDMGRQRLHKQIGCVTGFFQIFGRQHAINGKRLHHRSPMVDYSSELDRSVQSSSSVSIDLDDLNGKISPLSVKSSKRCPQTPEATKTPVEATTPVKTPPSGGCGYEFREMSRSTWKLRESPRLSLDSRSTTYGNKHIPSDEGVETNQRRSTSVIARLMGLETLPELTRSQKTSPDQLTRSASESRVCSDLFASRLIEGFDSCHKQSNITKTEAAAKCNTLDNVVTTQQQHKKPQHHRILSGDVYPDETQRPTSYGEVERKLKARGLSIDEPLMDLDTLKLLLEALQLKGLLRKTEQVQVNDPKPSGLRPPTKANYILGPRNTATARKAEDQRRGGAPPTRSECTRSPRKMKPIAKTEVSVRSSMSETAESVNAADKRCSVLERCDFLLHTIAEFNSMPSKLHQQGDQPSPVSVLDSSFYNDDSSSSLSPVMKRTIVFTDDVESVIIENDPWTPATAQISDDPDFIYISEILRLTKSPLSEPDIFTYLNINRDSCKLFKSQRKLVFDIATELIKKHAQVQECVPVSFDKRHPLDLVWSEFKKLRDQETEDEDLIEQIRSLLRKDLWNDLWSGHNVETKKETVVDVERLIFRDLIEETIRDVGRKFALTSPQPPLRKRLVF